MSVIIFALIMFYGSIKLVHLLSRHGPSISFHKEPDYFNSDKIVDFHEDKLRVAFGVEGFLDGETKDDPSFVKYMVRNYGKKDGVAYESILDYHVCSADELDKFGTPSG